MMAGMRVSPAASRVVPNPREGGEGEFLDALESVSRGIQDPAAKLRFIRRSLGRYHRAGRALDLVPVPSLRRWVLRRLSLEGLRFLISTDSLGVNVAIDPRTQGALALNRALTASAALGLVLLVGGVAYGVWSARPTAAPVFAAPPAAPVPSAAAQSLPSPDPVAETLPPLPAGIAPARVWLVEGGPGYEQLSNGLRIDTSFAVEGDPRRFRTFTLASGAASEVQTRPVGILFHTSESDVWPLEEGFNGHLRDSSHGLLRYVQRLKLYNYLIDRFGRTFRVVNEDSKANHAGHSIWEADGTYYLSLNNAFLGICFESRWEGGRALPITAAQLSAGRSLTEYLRQRFSIPGEMCVSHGLTSVNARSHLVGEHLDWARGFPFDAFGLPDQYTRRAPSVAAFGFTYDEGFLKVMGKPWPGIEDAELSLAQDARAAGKTVDEVRRERQGLYDRWLLEQAREEEAYASNRAKGPQNRGPQGG
jgi:hypothetical protein